MEKTMVELFAGVGGFRLGMEKTGWKTIWANQWEPSTKIQHAFSVYVANFGHDNAVNTDINKINKNDIPNHTLLVGGFPCQDYSVAQSKAEGIHGKKGVLWWDIKGTIETKKPPFLLLENVDRLIKSPANQRGRDFGVMLRTLCDLGYSLEWRVINAAEYGFPQKRRRIFLFGAHKTTNYYENLKKSDFKKTLTQTGFFLNEFPIDIEQTSNKKSVELSLTQSEYKNLYDLSKKFKSTFYNSGIMIEGNVFSIELKSKASKIMPLINILEKNVSQDFYIENNPKKVSRFKHMKGSKREKRVDKNGYEYTYSEGGMSFPDDINLPARTILTSESSVNRSTHVIEDPETKKLRLLTPIECERINGFPDNWTNPTNTSVNIPIRKRYFFMGNALVVGLVEKMGKKISDIVERE